MNFVSITAVRLDNEMYLFNGNYTIDNSFTYYGANTFFVYIKHSDWSPETFYSPGPLDSPIDVMVILVPFILNTYIFSIFSTYNFS